MKLKLFLIIPLFTLFACANGGNSNPINSPSVDLPISEPGENSSKPVVPSTGSEEQPEDSKKPESESFPPSLGDETRPSLTEGSIIFPPF